MIFNLGGALLKIPVLNGEYPADVTGKVVGQSATFEVEISAAGIPEFCTYQWFVDGAAVSGATGPNYTIPVLKKGSYTVYCEVTNAAGTVRSRAASMKVEPFYLFKSGVGFAEGYSGFTNAVYNSEKIYTNKALYLGDSEHEYIKCNKKVDVTHFTTVHFSGVYCDFNGNGNANSSDLTLFAGTKRKTVASVYTSGSINLAHDAAYSIDISGEEGEVDVGADLFSTSPNYSVTFKNFAIHNIWFE